MPKEQPSLYSIPKTTMWFAIVSIVLLVSLLWMVFADYSREWKGYQRRFIQLKMQKLGEDLKAADAKIDKAKLGDLEKQLAEARKEEKQHKKEFRAIQKDLDKLDLEIGKIKGEAQNLKQYQDSYKYYYEEHRAHGDTKGAGEYEKKLAELSPKAAEAKLALEALEKKREDKEAELRGLQEKGITLQKQLTALLTEKSRAEKKISSAKPSLAKDILNAPMIDFVAPSLRIQQVVLEDLYDDYHFSKVQKVDRCTTCHLGIDQKGFENAPQPFRTHPKLDLFLGAAAPHALEKVGCTVCHGGNGHSVSFIDSAHTPRNHDQAKEWEKKYRWHRLEKWDEPMLPLQHTEASCAKCHRGVVDVPQADKLNAGRRLAETEGCFGCHKVEGFENRWKVGPSLDRVQSKLDKDWILRWLQDPKAFRPSTKMPQIFHQSNTSSPEDRERNFAAIEGIATYLMKHSDTVELQKPPVAGDPENGQKLVKSVGCLGCHTAAGVSANDFGPELSGLGSKVKPEWLYSWLKDPKHFSKDTRMPNLRLSDQEAADITSYLLSQRNAEFDNQELPKIKPEVLDALVLTNLQKTKRHQDAEAELAKMSPEGKLEYLGKETIAFQGCFACHNIKGFEEAKPIGTELSNHGRKDVHQLYFGFIHLEHTREAWFFQKLKQPRIFDKGKELSYYEKARMPNFNFTDEQAASLVTFLLSLNRQEIPLEMQKRLDLKDRQIEEGRLLLHKLNCQGCHTLDGREGRIRQAIEDPGSAPPIIDGEGKKVQEKWLHEFLKAPTTIRPWLTYRMPTFGFDDEQARQLVQYFAALDKQEMSYQGHAAPPAPAEQIAAGKTLFEKFQCVKCHKISKESAAMGASFLAPDLTLAKDRLKPDWVVEWIRDPQALMEGTMMPAFFPDGQSPAPDILNGDAQAQIVAIRDYLYRYAPEGGDKPKAPETKVSA